MGASFATRVASEPARERMLAFLDENYRPWNAVVGTPEVGAVHLDGRGREVFDYREGRGKKCSIGTEYYAHLHGWESKYVSSLIRWVALKIGRTRTRFSREINGKTPILKPVPFIVYDSEEFWPILVTSLSGAFKIPKQRRWCAADRLGCYVSVEVNESLTMASFDTWITTDSRAYEAYKHEVDTVLGPLPNTSEERMRWLDRQTAIKIKHATPDCDRQLPIIRAELQRLNDLWK